MVITEQAFLQLLKESEDRQEKLNELERNVLQIKDTYMELRRMLAIDLLDWMAKENHQHSQIASGDIWVLNGRISGQRCTSAELVDKFLDETIW
jgi:hypothetical protein